MSIPIRVLILEDRPEDAELMLHELRRSQFQPEWRRVDTESEYNSHLGWRPDLILSDYNMPLLNAPHALALLKELNYDIPFIVVSGAIGEEVAVAMMRQGAADYLLKDRLARLGPAVRQALAEKKLREESRAAEEAFQAGEVRFYSFMNNSPALAYIKSDEGRILYMNNTCEQTWGVTLARCAGKRDDEVWPAEVAAQLREHDAAVLETRAPSRMLEEVSLPNGRSLHMLSFRFPFLDAAGRQFLGGVSVDLTEQVCSEKSLAEALAAKEVLLKELHHRVKNNLQVISSLLSMQAEALVDPAAHPALQESQKRVQSMALIHEKLTQDGDADHLDFAEYAETLSRELFYSYGADPDKGLRLELDPVCLGLRQAIPCGLILNELLTNALKYAFTKERRGEIRVGLACSPSEMVKLTVADDGVGLPAGFDWRRSQSLGLRIIAILGRQLDGNVEQTTADGAAFSLTFPREATSRDQQRPPGRERANPHKTFVSSIA